MKFCQDFQSFLHEARLSKKETIGEPFEVGNLEIAEYDLYPSMDLESAKKACLDLGSNWRLPTGDELEALFKENPTSLQNMHFRKNEYYWSSTERAGRLGRLYQTVRTSYSKSGKIDIVSYFTGDETESCYVRAVRSIK
jgi:hypothetical protein